MPKQIPHIPKNLKVPSLKIRCTHPDCDTYVRLKCKCNGEDLSACAHPEKLEFRSVVHVKGTKYGTRTKTLKTKNLNEAIAENALFREEVQNGKTQGSITDQKGEDKKPQYLLNQVALFCSYMRDENVPSHLKKNLSKDYLKDLEHQMKMLCECLQKEKINLSIFRMEDINDNTVGLVNDFLLHEKNFSNRSFNKYMTTYSSFMSWWMKNEKSTGDNFFSKVSHKKIIPNPETLESRKEFEDLLALVTPENGILHTPDKKKKKRNLFFPWLKSAYRLGLESGARRENVVHFKMSDVVEDDSGEPIILHAENIKVNRIMHISEENEKRSIPIPITENLKQLLFELGYEEYRKTKIDRYLIAPEITGKREAIMCDLLSRSFAHFYSKLDNGRELSFGALRKAYITQMEIYTGGKSETLVGHSNSNTKRHYVIPEIVAKASRNFKVFPERAKELQNARSLSDEKEIQKTIER